jgi:hypothetical protein
MYIYYAGNVFTPTESFTLTAIWILNVAPSGGSVTITGTQKVNNTLTANVTNASGYPTPTYTYKWRRGVLVGGVLYFSDISGATSSTYNLVSADVGYYIRVEVTFTNGIGSDQMAPATTGAIANLAQYTITWAANGGTVSPTSTIVTEGTSVTAPTPTRSGFTFSHWRNPPSGDLMYIYYAGNVFTPTESFTLTAIWTAVVPPPTTPPVTPPTTPPVTPPTVAVPSGGSVSLTGSGQVGTSIYAETPTNSWSGSPTSYSVVIRAASGSEPTSSSTIVAASINSNACFYDITSSDLNAARRFKAFALATNSGGNSNTVSSVTIFATSATPPPVTPPVTPPTAPPVTPPTTPPVTPPTAPPVTPPTTPPVTPPTAPPVTPPTTPPVTPPVAPNGTTCTSLDVRSAQCNTQGCSIGGCGSGAACNAGSTNRCRVGV